MVKSVNFLASLEYAGAGKTTALGVAKDVWEASGYRVHGLAPAGRAAEKLKQNSFQSFTLHKFLKDYEMDHSNPLEASPKLSQNDDRGAVPRKWVRISNKKEYEKFINQMKR
jgi:hypothetical protein